MKRVPAPVLWLVSLALAGSACDGCAPTSAAIVVDGNDVVVDADALVVTRAGREVLRVRPADIGTKQGNVFYEFEFGMFNIQEDLDPFVGGDTFVVTGTSATITTFDVTRGSDDDAVVIAQGIIAADNGGLRLQITAQEGHDRIRIATPCAPDHHFIGLGAQTHDVDHRGQVVPLWVSEQGVGKTDNDDLPTVWQLVGRRHTTHVPMPAFVRSDGTAVIVQTDAFARVDLCASDVDVTALEAWNDFVTVDVYARDTVLAAQQAMTAALGRPRLLPPYLLAPWNDAIESQAEVIETAAFLRDNDIPSSVLWSEDWRGGEFSGDVYRLDEDWRVDVDQYPDYPAMAATLKQQGFAHQVYFNTFVTQSGDVAAEIAEAGFDIRAADGEGSFLFAGADRDFSATALLDLTNEDAVAYMKNDHLVPAFAAGAAGWMADFAEWMPVEDVVLASGEDPALVHNRYPELWQRLNRDAISAAGADADAILFYRSGHLGSPPLVDVLWAGDQRTSFEDDDGLPTVLPIGIGTAVTGFPYFAHDIGGYQSSTNDPTTQELWFRWVELGAFTPVMRTHHGTHAALNHNFRTNAESTAHWKRYANLHMRLYPYLRALQRAASDVDADKDLAAGHGPLPLWVPLPLLHPDDEASWAIKDEVLLGPSLLVAPVVVEGATSRRVHLPPTAGDRYVRFVVPGDDGVFVDDDRAFAAGDVDVDAAVDDIPVFVKAGGIVPLTAEPALTLLETPGIELDLSSTRGDRVVVVALGADGRFVEEDGAEYVLDGAGIAGVGDGVDGGVDIVIDGDGTGSVVGDGFTLTLRRHPPGRVVRALLR
jgi:alpha-glucosidase